MRHRTTYSPRLPTFPLKNQWNAAAIPPPPLQAGCAMNGASGQRGSRGAAASGRQLIHTRRPGPNLKQNAAQNDQNVMDPRAPKAELQTKLTFWSGGAAEVYTGGLDLGPVGASK